MKVKALRAFIERAIDNIETEASGSNESLHTHVNAAVRTITTELARIRELIVDQHLVTRKHVVNGYTSYTSMVRDQGESHNAQNLLEHDNTRMLIVDHNAQNLLEHGATRKSVSEAVLGIERTLAKLDTRAGRAETKAEQESRDGHTLGLAAVVRMQSLGAAIEEVKAIAQTLRRNTENMMAIQLRLDADDRVLKAAYAWYDSPEADEVRTSELAQVIKAARAGEEE